MQKPKKFTFIGFFKLIFKIIVLFILGSVFLVAVYTVINPPITPLMLLRPIEGIIQGKLVGIDKDWVDYEEISPNLLRAVISAEDGKFLRHHGFDFSAMQQAFRNNANGKRIKGGSTISQQTAKNVFLWQGRNYIRKGLEAYFTILIEAIWGKKRILEIYVNSIEWGNGIYGVEAASQQYFKKSAKTITKREAALLAAVLPNPRKWSPAAPTGYIKQRSNGIQARMGGIALP